MDTASSSIAAGKRHWLWPTRRRFVIGFLIALVIWGWFDVRNRGRIDPLDRHAHKTDFTVYTEAGAAFFDGRPPYEVTNPRGWGYLYPPLFAMLVSPLHALPTQNQVYLWFLISLATCWGCYVELKRIGTLVLPAESTDGTFGRIPTWVGAIATAAATIPALNCLQRGQVGVAKLYLLLLGFRLLMEHRGWAKPVLGGAMLALAATLKITPIVPACIAVGQQLVAAWTSRQPLQWSRAASGAGGLGFGLALWLLFLPGLLVGWSNNTHHLQSWWYKVVARAEDTNADDFAGNSTSVRNQSLANSAYRLGNWAHYALGNGPHDEGPEQLRKGGSGLLMDAPWAQRLILTLRLLAGWTLLGVCLKAGRSRHLIDQAFGFGMACAATLVVFPIARGHYYMLLMPAIAFASVWFLHQEQRRRAIAVAVVPLILVICHYVALNHAGRVGLLGLGTAIWYLATCGAFLLARRETVTSSASLIEHDEPQRPASATRAA